MSTRFSPEYCLQPIVQAHNVYHCTFQAPSIAAQGIACNPLFRHIMFTIAHFKHLALQPWILLATYCPGTQCLPLHIPSTSHCSPEYCLQPNVQAHNVYHCTFQAPRIAAQGIACNLLFRQVRCYFMFKHSKRALAAWMCWSLFASRTQAASFPTFAPKQMTLYLWSKNVTMFGLTKSYLFIPLLHITGFNVCSVFSGQP